MTPNKNLTPLSDHLCFSLYTTSRAIQRLYIPSLEKHSLTYPQYLILVSLYDLGKISVKRIGEELDLASNTLTPLLKRMEQHGLIKRERSEEDERVVLLTITDFGKKIREESCDLPQILLNKSSLSDKEWNELARLLEKLHQDTKT
ncbi:MarR family winged helix-turn-helix transcriptional regulator [Lactovum miscens]|uniref:DNA-binding MarR family transcriptional regulator n=1 Tax=Lactovum miscens TaxID=190387 RepID=A0A841C8Y8_9LACT|nr:MarR family transcriptional regulator [Lactovum miscens]MBB5888052.1 DNA-binding MarR family transcriptional regulator [Lactovum miscens]